MAKKKKTQDLVRQWNDYFRRGELEDYQRLCGDLGLAADLPSKTKCVKALKSVYVNIPQFLQCKKKPDDVILFRGYGALLDYTVNNKMFFPRRKIPKGSPLEKLLKVLVH